MGNVHGVEESAGETTKAQPPPPADKGASKCDRERRWCPSWCCAWKSTEEAEYLRVGLWNFPWACVSSFFLSVAATGLMCDSVKLMGTEFLVMTKPVFDLLPAECVAQSVMEILSWINPVMTAFFVVNLLLCLLVLERNVAFRLGPLHATMMKTALGRVGQTVGMTVGQKVGKVGLALQSSFER